MSGPIPAVLLLRTVLNSVVVNPVLANGVTMAPPTLAELWTIVEFLMRRLAAIASPVCPMLTAPPDPALLRAIVLLKIAYPVPAELCSRERPPPRLPAELSWMLEFSIVIGPDTRPPPLPVVAVLPASVEDRIVRVPVFQ